MLSLSRPKYDHLSLSYHSARTLPRKALSKLPRNPRVVSAGRLSHHGKPFVAEGHVELFKNLMLLALALSAVVEPLGIPGATRDSLMLQANPKTLTMAAKLLDSPTGLF